MVKNKTEKPAESSKDEKVERSRKRSCFFCDNKIEPDYKRFDELKAFVTERARIVQRTRSGVCSKHQRSLARQIKRVRHLALLPFSVRV